MDQTKIKQPLWISHRGYKEQAVENTYEAFKAAVNMGFTALETDLRITKDNQIVLIHDHTLKRLSNDRRSVTNLSRSQLEEIRFRDGGQPLFFDQFIKEFSGCTWTFDIKYENGDKTIQTLASWAKSHGLEQLLTTNGRFLVWRASHEKLIRDLFPGAVFYARRIQCWRAGLAVIMGVPSLGAIRSNRTYALPPYLGSIWLFRKSFVRCFHRRRARTIAFLPETVHDTRAAIEAGFDEILTNGRIIDTDEGEND